MRRSIMEPGLVGQRGAVGKLADYQLPDRLTWPQVPDSNVAVAAMHVVHIVPAGATTITSVNPTDPATVGETSPGYLVRPSSWAPVLRAGRG